MGATVTGIDAGDENIKIAHIHAVCITHLHANYYLDLDKKCILLSFISLLLMPTKHIMLIYGLTHTLPDGILVLEHDHYASILSFWGLMIPCSFHQPLVIYSCRH
jgi:hypothetical protein